MSKIITDKEMLDIVSRVINGEVKLNPDDYKEFLNNLAETIAGVFGGSNSYPDYLDADLGFAIPFHIDQHVPHDGGVYAKYDTDVTWKNGREED